MSGREWLCKKSASLEAQVTERQSNGRENREVRRSDWGFLFEGIGPSDNGQPLFRVIGTNAAMRSANKRMFRCFI